MAAGSRRAIRFAESTRPARVQDASGQMSACSGWLTNAGRWHTVPAIEPPPARALPRSHRMPFHPTARRSWSRILAGTFAFTLCMSLASFGLTPAWAQRPWDTKDAIALVGKIDPSRPSATRSSVTKGNRVELKRVTLEIDSRGSLEHAKQPGLRGAERPFRHSRFQRWCPDCCRPARPSKQPNPVLQLPRSVP